MFYKFFICQLVFILVLLNCSSSYKITYELKDGSKKNIFIKNDVKTLDLRNKNIVTINSLENLDNLQSIILQNNHISDFEKLVFPKNIKSIQLSYNNLTDLDISRSYPNLKNLYLAYNKIEKIKNTELIKNVKFLNLYNNSISNIDFLIELENLVSIDLQKNKISDLKILQNLKKVEILYLSCNKITILSLKGMPKLTDLKLYDNKIEIINGITQLKSLKSFLVDYKYLKQINKSDYDFLINKKLIGQNDKNLLEKRIKAGLLKIIKK